MKVIKIFLKFIVIALSSFFDKKTYSAFDCFCYFSLFYVVNNILEQSVPTVLFCFSLIASLAFIAFLSGFLEAVFSVAKAYFIKGDKK